MDKVNRQVTLLDFDFTKASFRSAPDNGQAYVSIVNEHLPAQPVMSLDHLEADLNITEAQISTQRVPLNNDPPRILFSTAPAVLVLIDGPQVVKPVPKTKLERVINTHTLILFDPSKASYYLQIMDGWMESPDAEGPWTVSRKPPRELNKIRDQLVASKQVVLLEQEGPQGNESLKEGAPAIYVSTVPAELIQTQGEPQLTPIDGTGLLYVKNTAEGCEFPSLA